MNKYSFNNTVFILDDNQRETTQHGTDDFPCGEYYDEYYNNSFPWHWHDEMEFGYAEKGSLIISVNNNRFTLHEGEGIFINSGVLHAFNSCENIKSKFPTVIFLPTMLYSSKDSVYWQKYIRPIIEALNLSHIVFRNSVQWEKEVTALIIKAFSAMTNKKFGYELEVRNCLSSIILLICENYLVEIPDTAGYKSPELKRLQIMLDYIRAHGTEPIQMQHIADAAAISKSECLRCFNTIMGITPIQYVIELRTQKAAKLLRETSLSLSEICESSGFQSQSYFTKIFREKMGAAPGKWRNTNEDL